MKQFGAIQPKIIGPLFVHFIFDDFTSHDLERFYTKLFLWTYPTRHKNKNILIEESILIKIKFAVLKPKNMFTNILYPVI